jgi:hypothetical protein
MLARALLNSETRLQEGDLQNLETRLQEGDVLPNIVRYFIFSQYY